MYKTLAALILCTAAFAHAQTAPDAQPLPPPQELTSHGDSAANPGANRAYELVMTSLGSLGVRYKWGGESAQTGFDCSGFVRAMFGQALGLMLPRLAREQAAATQTIAKTDLQPCDLVFFNTLRRAYSHVGSYLGAGKFIHAPHRGAHVRLENFGTRYWQRRFNGARRVLAVGANVAQQDEGAATLQ
jgi:cell wall-associated NlpC family hydrolase